MTACIPNALLTFVPAQSNKINGAHAGMSVGTFRLPTDPLYNFDFTLHNIIAGSRYRITRSDTGAELATGVASGSGLVDVVISGVPAYANPMQMNIMVRNASGSPAYTPFATSAFSAKTGASAFILQQED